MSPETYALCKRATNAPRFEWADGMPVVDDSGARGIVVSRGPRWNDDPLREPNTDAAIGEGLMVWRPGYGLTVLSEWVLDVTRPGAIGHLFHIVRSVYNDEITISQGEGWWHIECWRGEWGDGNTKSLAEALVCALERALPAHMMTGSDPIDPYAEGAP